MRSNQTMLQEQFGFVGIDDVPRLVEVWEAAVRATHHFLSEADIATFRPMVREGLFGSMEMACIRDAGGQVAAFIGVAGQKIEALFVHPDLHGCGAGRYLTEYAIERWGANEVDVNEQNDQAIGFYEKLGFRMHGRSAVDNLGNPFPLLHMKLEAK